MGTFVFTWSQPASEVYVTGTFDDWKKTAKLDKENGVFSRQVDIPATDKPIYYKFVVDNAWTVDSSKPLETDSSGNVNNLLKPSDITPIPVGGRSHSGQHPAPVTAALLSSVGPAASTAVMAGQVPPEKTAAAAGDDAMPGDPSGDKTFSVNPLPATAGTGNPINLKPGEPVPPASAITSNTIQSNVKTDKASYEKSDAYPSSGEKTLDTNAGAFGVPPVSGNMIPESSLPMGTGATAGDPGPFIQSAGPGTTTAALAGQVPQEPRKDAEVVKGDENESGGLATVAGGAVAGVAAGAAAMAAGVPTSIQNAISSMTGGNKTETEEPTEPAAAVPEPVKHAQESAHASPEASGNPEAVTEKTEVEKELLNKVPRTDEASEPAPTASATQSAIAPGAPTTASASAFSKDPTIADESTAAAIAAVNAGPAPSQAAAFQGDPVAAGQTGKAGGDALNASAEQPAKTAATETQSAKQAAPPATPTTKASGVAKDGDATDSRDVSPKSKPVVTSGVETKTAASKQEAKQESKKEGAQASASGSPAAEAATDKKSKRRSFFGKIKDKLKS